jgi:chromosome segregation ATPase
MNAPDITFPSASPELKVKRTRSAGTGSAADGSASQLEERFKLEQILAEVQTREENLRAYEARLREWQEQLDGAHPQPPIKRPSLHPFVSTHTLRDESGLQAAWEKVHRSREILEAEQKHLIDDRLLLQERETALKKREAALALREERLAAREQAAPVAKPKTKKAPSAMESFTRAPFAMAKSVFGAKG